MKKIIFLLLVIMILFSTISCGTISSTTLNKLTTNSNTTSTTTTNSTITNMFTSDSEIVKNINAINLYPNIPDDYVYFDYNQYAKELDKVVFNFANNDNYVAPNYIATDPNSWSNIGFWIDQARQPSSYEPLTTGYLKRTYGISTYVGDTRIQSTGSEAITNIGMVLSSEYVGIDKSNQAFNDNVYNFVEMTLANYDTGSKLVTNGGVQGQSFWYDIFPQILFARLYYLNQDTEYMREMVLNGADQWLEALPFFIKDGKEDFEFVGYNVVLESPTTVGDHIEPPNGGLAFIFYSAYEMTKDIKYLNGAKFVLDYFDNYQYNPNYEAMTDYAPYVAAILNYKYGTNYDVGKFLDYIFEDDSKFRPGWSVMNGSFGNYSVNGLVGQSGDYAFSMNSFHLASVMAPMLKYDPRYANDIGKYFLNLVNNAKVFFPQNLTLAQQSMNTFLSFDRFGSITYEGFRNNYNGVNGYAMGDGTTIFGIPSDLSLYSSAFIGFLGGIVSKTNVNGILQLDLNNTDSFGENTYQYYSYYNPYSIAKTIEFKQQGSFDLFDVITKTIVASNCTDKANIDIPAASSRILVVLPANSNYTRVNDVFYANDIQIAKLQSAVNITNISMRQELTEASIIEINTFIPNNDEVMNMKIYFNDIELYNGVPINSFSYDKSKLPNTDYTIKIIITTNNGLQDSTSKRIICY